MLLADKRNILSQLVKINLFSRKFSAIFFFFIVFYTAVYSANAEVRIKQISSIRTKYLVSQNRLQIRWSSTFKSAKYKVTVQSQEGTVLVSSIKKTSSTKFKVSNFVEGQQLKIIVKAVADSSIKNIAPKTKKIIFTTKVATDAIFTNLKTTNSTGRKGVYFLPKNYRLKTLPIMLLFHGSSIDGKKIARIFKKLAGEENFIIIAPDSVNDYGWEYSLDSNSPSEDQRHIANCIEEVLALPHITIKTDKFLVAGVSAGGELAGFFGSNDSKFKSIAIMHGGVYSVGLGDNIVPVWLSTGTQDTLRPPTEVSGYQSILNARSFNDVVYHEYNVGHAVPEEEKIDLLEWWLGTDSSKITYYSDKN